MYNSKLHFHFTGIGGSGMSGIAEILLGLGFAVSGSDIKEGEMTTRLRERGATISLGHAPENLPLGASLVVYSSAVSLDNPELVEARRRELPVIRRAEVLAELMRLKYGVAVAGSHGKTTTTSMTATILEVGGLDPTVIIGGQVKSIGTGGKLGKGSVLVAESDESDRSFLLLKPTVAVVTNIDSEHLNAYASLTDLEESFEKFIEAVPFYGLAVLCIDDPKVRDLAHRCKSRKVTYGISPDADIRAENITTSKTTTSYDVVRGNKVLARIHLPMLGKHIAINSLAAIAVALEFEVSIDTIVMALNEFEGVGRRLEVIGEAQGVTVINDYGHHPTEVKATIGAIRAGWGDALRRFHVVFQPHRYSRTRDCFAQFLDAFHDCDALYLTDIYSAGEPPLEGITSEILSQAMQHQSCTYIGAYDTAVATVTPELKEGDVLLCLGAGSIGTLPRKFLEAIELRSAQAA
jgi:UDP-N-acetylmuramate--alanine ligase